MRSIYLLLMSFIVFYMGKCITRETNNSIRGAVILSSWIILFISFIIMILGL